MCFYLDPIYISNEIVMWSNILIFTSYVNYFFFQFNISFTFAMKTKMKFGI